MIDRVTLLRGRYQDSVRLMQAAAEARRVPGVDEALVAMGTDLNLDLLHDLGFDPASYTNATADDLIVAVRAGSESAIEAVAGVVTAQLEGGGTPGGAGMAESEPRTTRAAARIGGNLALISVPGRHAFVEAADALRAGLHVMVFSNNVAVEHEVELKRLATERGLLVMGPDCGTAIVAGTGLGFANAVQPGPVGMVGASGTGIQQLCCLLDDAGVGVMHALGTGSRDLSAAVGARSTLAGLDAVAADPRVEVIVVVSKPPDPEVAAAVERAATACAKPVIAAFVGRDTLEDAAGAAVAVLGGSMPEPPAWPAGTAHRPGVLRGLFAGGTLRAEAAAIGATRLGEVSFGEDAPGHTMIDFGDDRYTSGRPHPMIDQAIRLQRLERIAIDSDVGVVLIDVVLGYGAHPDPAAELAPVLAAVVEADVACVVSLCGTGHDPQDRDRQISLLREAGASVFCSNAAAARFAVAIATGEEAR